ncbi:MAG TPA: putative quinol monooxygenase [Candidatus Dormibacteraeota bacterium]|jgi:quinol monooxygenase YgiN|nr:putative quinol monooxygenase [Candidatus Dormibacteraeota bacterium]
MIEELDALIASVGMPVRQETLTSAWEITTRSDLAAALSGGHVLLIVTMRARPGHGHRLEQAAREFVQATGQLDGSLGSSLHGSPHESGSLHLVERFADESAFSRHMASDYFRRFQVEQQVLLAGPVEAVFLQR